MGRKIIQPDLLGRVSHERLNPRAERLAGIRKLTKWLTVPGGVFAADMVVTHIAHVMAGGEAGWRWLLVTSLALGAAFALSAVRLKWRRWSWLVFAAALAAHGYGMHRSYLAFADDYGVMEIVPEFEMVLLGALIVLHGLWSLLKEAAAGETEA